MRSPIRWVGGKTLLAKEIVKLIPKKHICYMEPFFGSGAVLFAKNRSQVEIANDTEDQLVTFFKVVKTRPDELLKWFDYVVISETEFRRVAESRPTDEIEIAGRFYYLNKICFSGEVTRPYFAPSVRPGGASSGRFPETLERDIRAMHERLRSVTFLCRDAIDVMNMADEDTVVYLDPPYPDTHGYAGGDVDWGAMIEWMKETPSRWILSVNTCEFVDENIVPLAAERGWSVDTREVYYSVSRSDDGRGVDNSEYIIASFRQERTPTLFDGIWEYE